MCIHIQCLHLILLCLILFCNVSYLWLSDAGYKRNKEVISCVYPLRRQHWILNILILHWCPVQYPIVPPCQELMYEMWRSSGLRNISMEAPVIVTIGQPFLLLSLTLNSVMEIGGSAERRRRRVLLTLTTLWKTNLDTNTWRGDQVNW